MQNPIPQTPAPALVLLEKNIHGVRTLGDIVGLKHYTEAVLMGARTALAGAQDTFTAARSARATAYGESAAVVAEANTFIARMVDALKVVFGRKWNASWPQAGFQQSLALPRTHSSRIYVLRCLETYLAAHPEAENPVQGLTHQVAGALYARYLAASNTVTHLRADTRAALDARDAALVVAQEKMRGLMRELIGLLPGSDPRWRQFGFNIPDDPSVPEAVETLEVAVRAPDTLSLKWEPGARAERYHVELLMVGAETEFHRAATAWDRHAKLTGLTPGTTVRVRVIAVNAAGEGVPSEAVEVPLPAQAQAA